MFMLGSDGRTDEGFAQYDAYVQANVSRFPAGALYLAQSDWYYGSADHRAPHDSRLESVSVHEADGPGEAHWHNRECSVEVRLRGACDDGTISFLYPKVHSYSFDLHASGPGAHADWRYDELRLDDQGHLVHEIEWCGMQNTARWLVVADDVQMTWQADSEAATIVTPV